MVRSFKQQSIPIELKIGAAITISSYKPKKVTQEEHCVKLNLLIYVIGCFLNLIVSLTDPLFFFSRSYCYTV